MIREQQVYNDGNKRTAVIFANHYMIANALGLFIIPYDKVSEFKQKLVLYYEDKDLVSVKEFLKGCWVQKQRLNHISLGKYDIFFLLRSFDFSNRLIGDRYFLP